MLESINSNNSTDQVVIVVMATMSFKPREHFHMHELGPSYEAEA